MYRRHDNGTVFVLKAELAAINCGPRHTGPRYVLQVVSVSVLLWPRDGIWCQSFSPPQPTTHKVPSGLLAPTIVICSFTCVGPDKSEVAGTRLQLPHPAAQAGGELATAERQLRVHKRLAETTASTGIWRDSYWTVAVGSTPHTPHVLGSKTFSLYPSVLCSQPAAGRAGGIYCTKPPLSGSTSKEEAHTRRTTLFLEVGVVCAGGRGAVCRREVTPPCTRVWGRRQAVENARGALTGQCESKR